MLFICILTPMRNSLKLWKGCHHSVNYTQRRIKRQHAACIVMHPQTGKYQCLNHSQVHNSALLVKFSITGSHVILECCIFPVTKVSFGGLLNCLKYSPVLRRNTTSWFFHLCCKTVSQIQHDFSKARIWDSTRQQCLVFLFLNHHLMGFVVTLVSLQDKKLENMSREKEKTVLSQPGLRLA